MTMYINFDLKSQDSVLTGYEWSVDNPKAVVYLIHGIGEHAGRYDRVGEALNNAGISLVSMDLRGHGRSPGKRGHIDDRTVVRKDIDNLIDYVMKRYPGVPLIHYGHSLGGNISLDYRLRGELSNEVSGYIITSPWIRLVRPISNTLYAAVKIGDKFMPKATIAQHIDNHMLGDLSLIKKEESPELRHEKISLHTAVEGYDIAESLIQNKIPDMYGGGKKPMLLMHGSHDPICDIDGSKAIAEIYSDTCEFVEWNEYLHELHNGTKNKSHEPVLEKMIDWISITVL